MRCKLLLLFHECPKTLESVIPLRGYEFYILLKWRQRFWHEKELGFTTYLSRLYNSGVFQHSKMLRHSLSTQFYAAT